VNEPTKFCGGCSEHKQLAAFSRNISKRDGLSARCKECNNSYNAEYAKTEAGKLARLKYNRTEGGKIMLRAAGLRYSSTERGRSLINANNSQWRQRNPEKVMAERVLNRAIKDGVIERMPCEVCGNPKSHGHHPDYTKPLEVIWLCAKHHAEEHMRLRDAA
jgi:hypothetical protein